MDRFNFSTANLRSVFAEEGKYDNFRAICRKLSAGEKIYEYDENGNERVMTKREANRAIRKVLMEVCGLNEDTVKSAKKRKRAIDAHINEIFEIIEEDIDFKVNEGFQDSEWFNEFVEMRNLALGDAEEYWTTDNVMMVVAEISGDHHDLKYCRVRIA